MGIPAFPRLLSRSSLSDRAEKTPGVGLYIGDAPVWIRLFWLRVLPLTLPSVSLYHHSLRTHPLQHGLGPGHFLCRGLVSADSFPPPLAATLSVQCQLRPGEKIKEEPHGIIVRLLSFLIHGRRPRNCERSDEQRDPGDTDSPGATARPV